MDEAMLRAALSDAVDLGQQVLAFFYEPSTLTQSSVIAVCLGLAYLLHHLTRGPIEAWARGIKRAPRILRIIAAVRRRMFLTYFVTLLWIATSVDAAAGGPRSQIISVVFKLALAYLVIAIVSRIVRNRLLSRLITVVAWGMAALSIVDLLDPVSVLLDSTAIHVGETRISVLLVLKAVLAVSLTLWLASTIGNFFNVRIQRSEELTPTLRVLIGKVLKIALMLVGLAVALAAIGVDLTALTVLSGALGVGIGFGLQKVVSNFISGIIILTDRSIKPGDTITLGDTFGWIRELRARFVSVVTRDGKEYLIPNEDFITNQVINWSFSDNLVRIDVNFHVSYESDPHEVMRISKEAARSVARVVEHKPVVCWLTGFGEFSLDFVLRFWIHDPPGGLANVRGQVLLALWDAFKENGIQIPYPRRDVSVRTPVEVSIRPNEREAQDWGRDQP